MYTDETKLKYGKYRNTMIKDIPKEYLVNAFKTGGNEHDELKGYIESNIELFPGLAMVAWVKKKMNCQITYKCAKRTFPTKKDAMDSIVKPKSKTNKPIPIRAYECPECSGWHLTSKPDKRFSTES
jgi:hypothetical protein